MLWPRQLWPLWTGLKSSSKAGWIPSWPRGCLDFRSVNQFCWITEMVVVFWLKRSVACVSVKPLIGFNMTFESESVVIPGFCFWPFSHQLWLGGVNLFKNVTILSPLLVFLTYASRFCIKLGLNLQMSLILKDGSLWWSSYLTCP